MWHRLFFFGLLYFVQGATLAYIVNFQKPYLLSQGISKGTIGMFTSLLLLPFIFKVGFGALSDRVPIGRWGSRKPYMILGLGIFIFSYCSLTLFPPAQNFFYFAALTFLAACGLAMFDTCADGWAVDACGSSEQSAVQAAMISGKSLGLVFMSVIFGNLLMSHQDYRAIFYILAGMAFVILVLSMLMPVGANVREKSAMRLEWRDLITSFYLHFAAFGVVYSAASFGTDGLLTLFLTEAKGVSLQMIGHFGMSRGIGALAGAVSYGIVQPRLGLGKTQFLALVFLSGGCLLPLLNLWPTAEGAMWGFAWGFQETAFVTLAMRYSQGRWAATFFAIAMIFSNVGTAIGEALGAPLVPRLGYDGVFVLFAALAISSMLVARKAVFHTRSISA